MEELPDLSNLSWEELLELRRAYEGDIDMQNYLAPYEHAAYAREDVRQQPYRALPYMAMIPLYQARKMVTGEGRSNPSLEALVMGYKGVYRGLRDYIKSKL